MKSVFTIQRAVWGFFLLFTLTLIACGGGGSTPAADPDPDPDPPSDPDPEPGSGSGNFSTDGFGFGIGQTPDPDVELWRFTSDDFGDMTSPAISSDGTIYIGSEDKFLYSINPDGTQKWKFRSETGDEINISPAIGSDGTIYFADLGGTLYALNPDGSKKWTFITSSFFGVSGIAIADDGTVLVNTDTSGLVALHIDGTTRWTAVSGMDFTTQSPVFDPHGNGTVYVPGDSLIAYDLLTGDKKWEFVSDDTIRLSPVIGGDKTLYFGDIGSTFYAIDQNGNEKWRFNIGSGTSDQTTSTPIIDQQGTIYVAVSNGNNPQLLAFTHEGVLKWSYDTGFSSNTPVIGKDGTTLIPQ